MPPMLHVTFFELMSGCAKNLLAGYFRLGVNERAHVLQLITKAVSAAGLIEGRPPPHAARKRLVEQPPIKHDVHSRVRGFDFYRPQQLIPVRYELLDRFLCYSQLPVLSRYGAGFFNALGFADDDNDLTLFARNHLDDRLHRRARIKSRAGSARELHSAESGRTRVRAIPAQKLFAVTSDGAVLLAHIGECYSMRELVVVRIAREDC